VRRFYLLAAIFLSLAAASGIYLQLVAGGMPEPEQLQLDQSVIALLLIAWLILDPELPLEQRPTFDHAFLLMISFPFLALYHQFLTRRWRGVATVAGFVALVFAPYLAIVAAIARLYS